MPDNDSGHSATVVVLMPPSIRRESCSLADTCSPLLVEYIALRSVLKRWMAREISGVLGKSHASRKASWPTTLLRSTRLGRSRIDNVAGHAARRWSFEN